MLEFKGVDFRYSGDRVAMLDQLSFRVESRAFVSLIGRSGCGKSTIFRLINGFEQPQAGTIEWNGENITGQERYCAYMPQKDLLLSWRTVLENLALPLELQGVRKAEIRRRALELLEILNLEDAKDKRPAELSGGMRQRVALARTLLVGCDLLLLDEPFSALDALTRRDLCAWLKDIHRRFQKTILFITHNVDEAIDLSDRIFLIRERPIRDFHIFESDSERGRTLKSRGGAMSPDDSPRSIQDSAMAKHENVNRDSADIFTRGFNREEMLAELESEPADLPGRFEGQALESDRTREKGEW